MLRNVLCGLFLSAALFSGCKSSQVTDVKNAAGDEACNQGCESARVECYDKCKEDVNKDVCEVACKEGNDKCVSDCQNKGVR